MPPSPVLPPLLSATVPLRCVRDFISMSSSSRRMTGNGSGASQGWGPRNEVMMTTFAAALIWRAIAFEAWFTAVKIGADARWRSPTFRNVYSPKTPQSSSNNSRWELNHWNCWRSLGDSNPCFRRERAVLAQALANAPGQLGSPRVDNCAVASVKQGRHPANRVRFTAIVAPRC
jgi:hypothetical protein